MVIYKYFMMLALMVSIGSGFMSPKALAAQQEDIKTIPNWSILWGNKYGSIEELIKGVDPANWIAVSHGKSLPEKPKGISTAWVKIQLPSSIHNNDGVYIKKMFFQSLMVFAEDQLLLGLDYNYDYDLHRILIPLVTDNAGQTMYMKMETNRERLGIQSDILFAQSALFMPSFMTSDIEDVVIGSAFCIIAVFMMICSLFLKRIQLAIWISLTMILLTTGSLLILYSPFTYIMLPKHGALFSVLFDLSLAILLPMLSYFFEKIFHESRLKELQYFRKLQTGYSIFLVIFMMASYWYPDLFSKAYVFASVTIQGCLMLIQFSLLIGFSIFFLKKGDKNAIIFSSGSTFLALMSMIDLVRFYLSSESVHFIFWKWGVMGFIISLIVLLGRRLAAYQNYMENYAREREFYNKQIQQSDKMETITSLAASVAHEVRNPLQVTRGFLQLVSERTDEKNKQYMEVAIKELDRASEIITDFLMFSKPEMEEMTELNVSDELKRIEGITLPLATLYGGGVELNIQQDLYIQGNSSKFKQAFINIIKNGIEAFCGEGYIQIQAYRRKDKVFIHIKDNGEGIEQSELDKLGKPYFSTKMEGTGLGLMVTFRIIEAMQGTIRFTSQINVGTEVVICFPALNKIS